MSNRRTAARMPDDVVIGLDVGTTARQGRRIRRRQPLARGAEREYPLLRPAPGQRVQDPYAVLAAVGAALAACAASSGARIAAVCVSTAMHGLVGLDADLRP